MSQIGLSSLPQVKQGKDSNGLAKPASPQNPVSVIEQSEKKYQIESKIDNVKVKQVYGSSTLEEHGKITCNFVDSSFKNSETGKFKEDKFFVTI